MESATRAGEVDGLLAAVRDRHDYDPRGRFIRRAELAEAAWVAYRDAYRAAFERAVRR